MADNVKILKQYKFVVDIFQILSVGLFTFLSLEEYPVIWVRLVEIVDGGNDLVEGVPFQYFPGLLPAACVHAHLYSLEYLDVAAQRVLDSLKFGLLCADVKILGTRHVFAWDVRDVNVIVVGEYNAAQPFVQSRTCAEFCACPLAVERELAVVVRVEQVLHLN